MLQRRDELKEGHTSDKTTDEVRALASYLANNAPMFRASEVPAAALRRLVSRSPAYNVEETDVRRGIYVYVRGVPATYACLLLHGRLQIASGAEELPSELGPWILLGAAALTDAHYVPEFTAQVTTAARVFIVQRSDFRALSKGKETNTPFAFR